MNGILYGVVLRKGDDIFFMNIKKFLRERAEKDAEALLTEQDRLFIKELFKKSQESDKKEKAEKISKNDKDN